MLSQRSKRCSDIELGSASDAYVKMRKMKADELLDQGKNLFTSRRNSGPVWALIEGRQG